MMKLFSKTTALLTMLVVFLSFTSQSQAMTKTYTSSFADNPRVLIVTGKFNAIEKQLAIWENTKEAMAERHIVVLRGNANKTLTIDEALSNANYPINKMESFEPFVSNKASDFAVFLIGKDGGLKQQWQEITDFDDIAVIIDQMPMRQNEAQ